MSADTDRLAETVRNGLIKGSRDSQLLDGREYDAAYWADADAALDGLVREHTRQEEALKALEYVCSDDGIVYCPWCHVREPNHSARCLRQVALSPPPVASGETGQ